MRTNLQNFTDIKSALERKGVNMDLFDISLQDEEIRLAFTDAYNVSCGLNSGYVAFRLRDRSMEQMVFDIKNVIDAWETVAVTADRVELGE